MVSELICNSLRRRGLEVDVVALIKRVECVQKSAIAALGARPNAKVHYDSLVVESSIERYVDLLLVDDVVTRGCTLM